jgi:hypothetical protein
MRHTPGANDWQPEDCFCPADTAGICGPPEQVFWKARFWNNAYGVVSVGGHANLAQLLDYIQDQERPPG